MQPQDVKQLLVFNTGKQKELYEAYTKNYVQYEVLGIGQEWFVKFPDANALTKIQILDVTEETVKVKYDLELGSEMKNRFKTSDLTFVERIK